MTIRDGRLKAIKSYEQKIAEHQRALDTIKRIPTDKVLHVIRPFLLTGPKTNRNTGYQDCGTILIPRVWNADSLRCHILAVEPTSYAADQLIQAEARSESVVSPVRFLDIKSWKLFDKQDAGLYVNWAALTRDFKSIAFGA
jgi:hypothetical protein